MSNEYEKKRDREQKRIDAFYEGWKSVVGRNPEAEQDFDPIIFSEDTPYMSVREAYRFGRRRGCERLEELKEEAKDIEDEKHRKLIKV